MSAGWMEANLGVQGYCLRPDEARGLRWGLRFPTALCLVIVITGLALQSAVLILALVPIGAVAGWTRRHPFDLIWNHAVRHLNGAPPLPPNPRPRRHSFKIATLWLLAVACCSPSGSRRPRLCSAPSWSRSADW
jgi:hypothetical protein